MWSVHLFKNVGARDLLNCTYATKKFNDFYKPKRTTLFMEEVFPHISRYLYPRDNLKCRLVCRNWRDAVDNHLQTHPFHYDNGMKLRIQHPHDDDTFGEGFFYMPYENDVMKLEKRADTSYTMSNLFSVSRYFYYNEDSSDNFNLRNMARQRTAMEKLLNKLGKEVRNCKLSFNNRDPTTNLYRVVRCWLTLMPNLETLALLHSGHDHPSFAVTPSLQNMLQCEPFPQLPYLVCLAVGVGGITEIGAMNAYSCQVQKLFCVNIQASHRFIDDKSKVCHLRHLEELNTSIMGFGSLLPILKKIPSPLKAVKLSGTLNTFLYQQPTFTARQKKWSQNDQLTVLFRDVSLFGSSLNCFDLQFSWVNPQVTNSVFMSKENLNLPLLCTLKLDAGRNQVPSLDFLLPCKSLQSLTLKINIPAISQMLRRRRVRAPAIQFSGYEETLYDSNIWKIFPKLRYVTLWTTLEPEPPTETKSFDRFARSVAHLPVRKYTYNWYEYEASRASKSKLKLNMG